ncbi:hypothetical protein [Pseudalkalibacillus berkeleyi]|uniref:Flagellar protein FliT n=1 Tax=Pseudalkalibacillus berkeleyi TaxID=1069813 RepID=A0ABS9H165_9BACL|nr:hypothetical protein [Pseudalkalibacillus berkeleyi]MCF6138748.1 hypothetical protein [Pseudalkalibacillus berkeleyi]
MSQVQELLEHTEKLYDHVQKGLPEDEPEDYLDELNQYMEYRQKLIERLSGDYTDKEKELGKQLVEINKLIQPYLNDQMKHIKMQLMKIQTKRTNNTKYANPYQTNRADGMFFDKRK